MQTPTLITIELEPGEGRRGGWRARTRVDGREARARRPMAPGATVVAAEGPDVAWTPTPYEPGPCTCEDGLCDRDHEHE